MIPAVACYATFHRTFSATSPTWTSDHASLLFFTELRALIVSVRSMFVTLGVFPLTAGSHRSTSRRQPPLVYQYRLAWPLSILATRRC